MSATLKCARGDLAIIIKDELGCEENVGRIVIVTNDGVLDPRFGWMWVIKPLDQSAMLCIDDVTETVKISHKGVRHQDDWLKPIRPDVEPTAIEQLDRSVLEEELQ